MRLSPYILVLRFCHWRAVRRRGEKVDYTLIVLHLYIRGRTPSAVCGRGARGHGARAERERTRARKGRGDGRCACAGGRRGRRRAARDVCHTWRQGPSRARSAAALWFAWGAFALSSGRGDGGGEGARTLLLKHRLMARAHAGRAGSATRYLTCPEVQARRRGGQELFRPQPGATTLARLNQLVAATTWKVRKELRSVAAPA